MHAKHSAVAALQQFSRVFGYSGYSGYSEYSGICEHGYSLKSTHVSFLSHIPEYTPRSMQGSPHSFPLHVETKIICNISVLNNVTEYNFALQKIKFIIKKCRMLTGLRPWTGRGVMVWDDVVVTRLCW